MMVLVVLGLDAPVWATPGAVVPSFCDNDTNFLDGGFRSASAT